MTKLDELIERLEKATGRDAMLDTAIYWAVVGKKDGGGIPFYTSSIDAAMTLLGDDAVLQNLSRRTQPEMGGRMWSASVKSHAHFNSGGQRTPAIAVCAAALRTRKAQETGE